MQVIDLAAQLGDPDPEVQVPGGERRAGDDAERGTERNGVLEGLSLLP